jgi:hypothetical protein
MAARLLALRAGSPLPPGRFVVLISVRVWVVPTAIVWLEGLDQLKRVNNLIRNRIRDLPACSIVPQPTGYISIFWWGRRRLFCWVRPKELTTIIGLVRWLTYPVSNVVCVLLVFFSITDDGGSPPSNPVRYVPSSEPFWIYEYSKFEGKCSASHRINRRRLCVTLNCRFRVKKPDTSFLTY